MLLFASEVRISKSKILCLVISILSGILYISDGRVMLAGQYAGEQIF